MAFRETVGSLFRCFVRRDSSSSDEAKQTKTILLRDDDEAVEAAVRAKRIPSHDGGQERDLVLHIGPDQGCAPKKDADPTSSPSSPSSPSSNQQHERHDSAPTTSNSNSNNSNSNSNTHTSNKTANAWEQQRPALTTLRTSATMSVRKSKAVAAAVALKARKDLANKRRKAYTKALGSLRMGFIDGDGFDRERERECECECETDAKGGSFWRGEDWFEWLDEEDREREREHRRTRNQWQHTFLNYWDEDDSPNRKKKKKKKKTMASQFSALSDPASSNTNTNTNALPPTHSINVRVLHREYVNYASNLPVTPEGSIFVRVPENRLDLPRVLITGPHDTPYSNGLFFFDCFLKDYPDTPPMVRFLTTGNGKVRFNPNLYNCGKVCLSLLGTWQGPGWNPGSSTLLQVLVSCQGLILGTEEPFYNEPGYEIYKGTKECRKESNRYNTELRKQTLKWGILDPLKKIVLQEERIEERRLALEELRKQRSRPPRSREDVDANETRHQREDGDYDQQQQQQQQLDNESSSVPGSNGRDGCTAGHKPILATKTQASNNANANASNSSTQANTNATAKSKPWSTVLPWSFSSKPSPSTEFAAHPSAKATTTTTTTTSTSTTTTTTSSNPGLLPRCDCDYPEFTTIAIRHFVETADHLEEQLKSWTQLDPSRATKQHAEEIRVWLKRLLDLVEARSQRRRGTTKNNTPLEQQQQEQQQQRRAPDQVATATATATATRAGNA